MGFATLQVADNRAEMGALDRPRTLEEFRELFVDRRRALEARAVRADIRKGST